MTAAEQDWTCPDCGAIDPTVDSRKVPGFAGVIYVMTYACCGHEEYDMSGDSAEAAR